MWCSMHFLLFFKCPSQTHMILTICMFCRYDCAYGPNDHHNDPNRARSIKQGCLPTFSIKWLYTWPNVVELCFYRWTHTQTNGEPTYGQRDSESSIRMSQYAPRISQSLKDHIWTQLFGTSPNKFMTSTKQFGGNVWMLKKPWQKMTSSNNKTLHIWIKNIKKGVEAQKLNHFNLILGFTPFWTCILSWRSRQN